MGIFDFLKNAGRKIDDDDKPAAKSAPKPDPNAVREKFEEARERGREAQLIKLIDSMGFKLQNLSVNVEDDTVTLTGTARSQEEREKVVLLVGNTQGIAKVDDRLAVASQMAAEAPAGGAMPGTVRASTGGEQQAQFYTVASGDSLSKIAKKYYGNANEYMKIFEANKPMLKDPDEIYPGQVLRIPGATSAAAPASSPSGARA